MSFASAIEVVYQRLRAAHPTTEKSQVAEALTIAVSQGYLVLPKDNLSAEPARKQFTWTRIDPDGPGLHKPQREGDVGWDLEAAEDVVLHPSQQTDVPTNVRIQLPSNCWGEIRARSSIARMGLQVDAGVLDNGYTGPVLVLMRNLSRHPRDNKACDGWGNVKIEKGQRVAQLVLHPAIWAEAQEVQHIDHDPRRGEAGFGSSGR